MGQKTYKQTEGGVTVWASWCISVVSISPAYLFGNLKLLLDLGGETLAN